MVPFLAPTETHKAQDQENRGRRIRPREIWTLRLRLLAGGTEAPGLDAGMLTNPLLGAGYACAHTYHDGKDNRLVAGQSDSMYY